MATQSASSIDIAAILAQFQQAEALKRQTLSTQQRATAKDIEIARPSEVAEAIEATPVKPANPLPSGTTRGQEVIVRTRNRLENTASTQEQLAAQGQSELDKILNLSARGSKAAVDYNAATVDQAELTATNSIATAQKNKDAGTHYNALANNPALNAQLQTSSTESITLQAELDAISADNSPTGIFKQLFLAPGKRKALATLNNSILSMQQRKGQAAINYSQTRQANSQMVADQTASEVAELTKRIAVSQSAMNLVKTQGNLTTNNVSAIASQMGLNAAASQSFQDEMIQLQREDNMTAAGITAAAEKARLTDVKKERKRILKIKDKTHASWISENDRFERYLRESDQEERIGQIDAFSLLTTNIDSALAARYQTWQANSRNHITTNQWSGYIVDVGSETYDIDDPKSKAFLTNAIKIIDSFNATNVKWNRANPDAPRVILDKNSRDPKMVAEIDSALYKQTLADNQDISDAINQGRTQMVSLTTMLASTPEAEWADTFSEFDQETLAFLAAGGMKETPTEITRDAPAAITAMMVSIATEVFALPKPEARKAINSKSKALAAWYKMQFKQISIGEMQGLSGLTVYGVDDFVTGDRGALEADIPFDMTSASDWSIRLQRAYVQKIQLQKRISEPLIGARGL